MVEGSTNVVRSLYYYELVNENMGYLTGRPMLAPLLDRKKLELD